MSKQALWLPVELKPHRVMDLLQSWQNSQTMQDSLCGSSGHHNVKFRSMQGGPVWHHIQCRPINLIPTLLCSHNDKDVKCVFQIITLKVTYGLDKTGSAHLALHNEFNWHNESPSCCVFLHHYSPYIFSVRGNGLVKWGGPFHLQLPVTLIISSARMCIYPPHHYHHPQRSLAASAINFHCWLKQDSFMQVSYQRNFIEMHFVKAFSLLLFLPLTPLMKTYIGEYHIFWHTGQKKIWSS